MNKILKILGMGIMAISIVSNLGTEIKANGNMVNIKVSDEKGEMVDIKVPKNPKKIVVLDYLVADQIKAWGLEDNIVGMSKSTPVLFLKDLIEDSRIKSTGSLKEIDMEEVMSLEPDVIFTSGRSRVKYKELSAIAPTVMSMLDYKKGSLESFKEITRRNAKIFGKEKEAEEIIAKTEDRIAKIKAKSNGKTAILGIIVGGGLKTLGNNSRGSIIGTDMGFKNVLADKNSTHGNLSSFELVLKADPDYIFIISKDLATSSKKAKASESIMDNEIIHKTKAYKNGNIIYLNPEAWYLSEGGIMTMDTMLNDIESAFKN